MRQPVYNSSLVSMYQRLTWRFRTETLRIRLEFLYIVHGLLYYLEALEAIEANNIFMYLLFQPPIQVRFPQK